MSDYTDAWRQLGELLSGRPDWRMEHDNDAGVV